MITELRKCEDFEHLLESSKTHPVIIFKHSTQCAISDQVYEEFCRFVESAGNIICGLVLVIEWRAVSNAVESMLDIPHESPQAILVRDGKPKWNASHWSITYDALTRALYAESSHQ
jgi:bacillithiol system protein YtxJ